MKILQQHVQDYNTDAAHLQLKHAGIGLKEYQESLKQEQAPCFITIAQNCGMLDVTELTRRLFAMLLPPAASILNSKQHKEPFGINNN